MFRFPLFQASVLFARAFPPQGGFKPHQAKLKTRSDLFQWQQKLHPEQFFFFFFAAADSMSH